MDALEKQIEQVLYKLIELELEEEIMEMTKRFAKLLSSVQEAGLISI